MSIYECYSLGIVCRGEKEFVSCQRKYMLRGYDWYDGNNKKILKYDEIMGVDGIGLVDDGIKPFILYLNNDKKIFGFDEYDLKIKRKLGHLKIVEFNDREKKLERILKIG